MSTSPAARRTSPTRRSKAAISAACGTAAVLAGLLPAAPARADLVESTWLNSDLFAVRLTHMPDFDQRRIQVPPQLGLPGGGNMYCVPTGVLNLAGYAANHGFPQVLEPTWWQGQAAYPLTTELLRVLGVIGGTTTSGGTGLGGMRAQAESLFPASLFTVTVDGPSFWWAPKVSELSKMVRDGGIVSFCHGWYAFDGNFVERNGGHCITFTRAYHDPIRQEIWARDPADDGGNATQSPFIERTYTFDDSPYVTLNDGIKVMSRIFAAPGESAVRLIDGYCLVKPRWLASFPPGGTGLQIDWAVQLHAQLELPSSIELPEGTSAIIPGPMQDVLYAAALNAAGQSTLFRSDLVETEWIELPVPVPPSPYLEIANDRMLLVVGDGQVLRVLLDTEVPDIMGETSAPPNAIASFDPELGRLVLLDPSARRVFLHPQDLSSPPQILSLPPGEPFAPETSVVWDPIRGGLWINDPAAPGALVLATPIPGTPLMSLEGAELPDLADPVLLTVDGEGHLLFAVEGRIQEYRQADDGVWERNEASPFDGVPANDRSIFSRSRTNFDPEIHDEERWRNVLPESFATAVPDCPADLDLDATVGFEDVLLLLADWGPCPEGEFCDADLDGDLEAGFSDLLLLLGAWGNCG